MKEYSEAEIKSKAEVYCSSVERCPSSWTDFGGNGFGMGTER